MNWVNIIRSKDSADARDAAWSLLLVVAALAVTALVVVHLSASPAQPSVDQRSARSSDDAATGQVSPMAQVLNCEGNTDARLITVSLSEQSLALCEHDNPVGYSPVTTGRVALGDGTPLGTWHINSRETDRFLTGPDYRVFVNYWLPFFGDYGFHDSSWQDFAYGDTTAYKSRGSRGCIHVPRPEMDKLYQWVRIGTTVTIVP
jgi:lipoprotein-anchoring transpeptidase ErfK/SrfK